MAALKGVDISTWQGNVDFKKVKASGIQFAIIRSGYSQTIDDKFYANVRGAKEAGLPVYGVYHFSYARNIEAAKQEAATCLAAVEKAGLGKNTIIFFDFEYDSVNNAKKYGIILGRSECIQLSKTFCEFVESQGYRAGIYCNVDYYRTMYDPALIAKYVFWLADWSPNPEYKCDFHQYSKKGVVSGINGYVDLDYCLMNIDDVFGSTNKPSTPTQSENKSIDTLAQEVIAGKWGNGDARKSSLTAAGYDYAAVQNRVNELLTKPSSNQTSPTVNKVTATAYARSFDSRFSGIWKVNAYGGLHCRNDAGTNHKSLCVIPNQTEVRCYGYYTSVDGVKWLYVQFTLKGTSYIGFVSSEYLTK